VAARAKRPPHRGRRLRPRNWPVRWRLAAASAGLTLIILLAFGAVIGKVATNRIRDDFNNEVRGAAQTLASEIRIGYSPLGTVIQSPSLDDFVRPDQATARVYDLNGNLIEHSSESDYLGPATLGLSTFQGNRVATA
jgi:hypothetical protein